MKVLRIPYFRCPQSSAVLRTFDCSIYFVQIPECEWQRVRCQLQNDVTRNSLHFLRQKYGSVMHSDWSFVTFPEFFWFVLCSYFNSRFFHEQNIITTVNTRWEFSFQNSFHSNRELRSANFRFYKSE